MVRASPDTVGSVVSQPLHAMARQTEQKGAEQIGHRSPWALHRTCHAAGTVRVAARPAGVVGTSGPFRIDRSDPMPAVHPPGQHADEAHREDDDGPEHHDFLLGAVPQDATPMVLGVWARVEARTAMPGRATHFSTPNASSSGDARRAASCPVARAGRAGWSASPPQNEDGDAQEGKTDEKCHAVRSGNAQR
jgi:hypothetical protein